MQSLDDYLTDQYLADQRELARLELDIQNTSLTLFDEYVAGIGWPYRLKRGAEDDPSEKPSKVSHSTTAMVTLSLVKLLGEWIRPFGDANVPHFPPPKWKSPDNARGVVDGARGLIAAEISKHTGTSSDTYG